MFSFLVLDWLFYLRVLETTDWWKGEITEPGGL